MRQPKKLREFWSSLNSGRISWQFFDSASVEEGRQAIKWLKERKFVVSGEVKSSQGYFPTFYVNSKYGNLNPEDEEGVLYFTREPYVRDYERYCRTIAEKLKLEKLNIRTIERHV